MSDTYQSENLDSNEALRFELSELIKKINEAKVTDKQLDTVVGKLIDVVEYIEKCKCDPGDYCLCYEVEPCCDNVGQCICWSR